jgi:hypothetical protein
VNRELNPFRYVVKANNDIMPETTASTNTSDSQNADQESDSITGITKKKLGRTFEQELTYITRVSPHMYEIRPGFVPHMKVPAQIYVDSHIDEILIEELETCCAHDGSGGGFLPALKQAANVAALPGIVKASLAMPDIHSGYGFCIGYVRE